MNISPFQQALRDVDAAEEYLESCEQRLSYMLDLRSILAVARQHADQHSESFAEIVDRFDGPEPYGPIQPAIDSLCREVTSAVRSLNIRKQLLARAKDQTS